MTLKLPATVCWPIHRVATSGKYQDSLREIEMEWSLTDLWDANAVLDAMTDAEIEE